MTDGVRLLPSIETLRHFFVYDPDTGILRWRVSRLRWPPGRECGCPDGRGRLRLELRGRSYPVHRICFALFHGRWPNEQIDHINGHRRDNRIVNLREATPSENARNRGPHPNKAGLKGVTLHKGRFIARIRAQGRSIHLGCFDTAKEAAAAYDVAALRHHGAFARINGSIHG